MHKLLGKNILVIVAHPDDESFLVSGTAYKNYLVGGKTFLICATLGEKGASHLEKSLASAKIKFLRKKELEKASRCLKISKLFLLNLPDGSLKKYEKVLMNKCFVLAMKLKPEIIISFGEDGISGHLDHIVIGKVARKIADRLNIPFAAVAISNRFRRETKKWLIQRRRVRHYSPNLNHGQPNVIIKVSAKIKKKALSCHQSQLDHGEPFKNFPSHAREEFMTREYFVFTPWPQSGFTGYNKPKERSRS